MGARNWTAAEEDLLRHLANSGATVGEIAERTGRTEVAIIVRMKSLGIGRAHKKKTWRKWSEEDIATLTGLHGEGVPLRAIATRMGRGHTAVADKARKIGLCRYGTPPEIIGDNAASGLDETVVTERAQRTFSEAETRRVRQFLARGDTYADVARQMRCDVVDIERIAGSADGLPRGDCGGAGARPRQPQTKATTAAPRYNFFRESIL